MRSVLFCFALFLFGNIHSYLRIHNTHPLTFSWYCKYYGDGVIKSDQMIILGKLQDWGNIHQSELQCVNHERDYGVYVKSIYRTRSHLRAGNLRYAIWEF